MSKHVNAVIVKEGKWYVARCLEIDVVSQGKTIEKALANLREAVELYVESFGAKSLSKHQQGIALFPLEISAHA